MNIIDSSVTYYQGGASLIKTLPCPLLCQYFILMDSILNKPEAPGQATELREAQSHSFTFLIILLELMCGMFYEQNLISI